MKEVSREFEAFGYYILAEVDPFNEQFNMEPGSVSFKIYEDQNVFAATLADAPKPQFTPFIEGYIKWDGCSNWNFPHDHYPLHFCTSNQAIQFGHLIAEMYKVGAELLPHHAKNILDKVD